MYYNLTEVTPLNVGTCFVGFFVVGYYCSHIWDELYDLRVMSENIEAKLSKIQSVPVNNATESKIEIPEISNVLVTHIRSLSESRKRRLEHMLVTNPGADLKFDAVQNVLQIVQNLQ